MSSFVFMHLLLEVACVIHLQLFFVCICAKSAYVGELDGVLKLVLLELLILKIYYILHRQTVKTVG